MTTHKVADLPDDLLNLFVAKAEGWSWFRNKRDGVSVRRPDDTSFEAGNYQAKYDPQTGERLPEFSIFEAVNAYGDLDWATDWSKGGPIIEREGFDLEYHDELVLGTSEKWWEAYRRSDDGSGCQCFTGPTPLVAAMRAYVASKFGETVELP